MLEENAESAPAADGSVCDLVLEDNGGEAERDASLLGRFAVLCHADLKKWKFYHWFCYPCFALERPAELAAAAPLAAEEGEGARCEGLCAAVLAWRGACAAGEGAAQQEIVAPAAFTCGFRRAAAGASAEVKWERLDLAAVGEAFHSSDRGEGLVLAAFDPCASGSDANSAAAGWPVRNLLALAAARWVAPGEQPLRLGLRVSDLALFAGAPPLELGRQSLHLRASLHRAAAAAGSK